jgi:hypothetical protein
MSTTDYLVLISLQGIDMPDDQNDSKSTAKAEAKREVAETKREVAEDTRAVAEEIRIGGEAERSVAHH